MAATNPIIPQSSYNNIGVSFLTPLVTADGISVANDESYPGTGDTWAQFDCANEIFKADTIGEYTSAAGVTIDSFLVKDGGARLANNTMLLARNAANNANIDLFKLNGSNKLEVSSTLGLNWATFTPSAYGGTGSLTFSSVTPANNFYVRIGDLLIFHFRATGTTGGTASNELTWDMPAGLTAQAINLELACTVFENSGNSKPGRCYAVSGTQFRVSKYDLSNFTLAANTGFIVQGCLRLA